MEREIIFFKSIHHNKGVFFTEDSQFEDFKLDCNILKSDLEIAYYFKLIFENNIVRFEQLFKKHLIEVDTRSEDETIYGYVIDDSRVVATTNFDTFIEGYNFTLRRNPTTRMTDFKIEITEQGKKININSNYWGSGFNKRIDTFFKDKIISKLPDLKINYICNSVGIYKEVEDKPDITIIIKNGMLEVHSFNIIHNHNALNIKLPIEKYNVIIGCGLERFKIKEIEEL